MFGKIQNVEIFRLDDSYLEEQVKAVSMGEIETTTNDKKILFTFGLASCIGIYIYSKNFGILGHIDSGDMFDQHFEQEYKQINGKWVRITGEFKQIGKIMYIIRKNITEIVTPIKIGMIIGNNASIMSEDAIRKLDFAIDLIIRITKNMGLSIEKQAPIISSTVIVDTKNLLLKTEKSMEQIKKRTI